MIYYIWTMANAFLGSYTRILSMVSLVAAAFTISFIFPYVSLLVLGGTLVASTFISIKKVLDARQANQKDDALEQSIEELTRLIDEAKNEHAENKHQYQELAEKIVQLQQQKIVLRKLLAYYTIINTKIQAMSPLEEGLYFQSTEGRAIKALFAKIDNSEMSTKDMLALGQTLEALVKPNLTPNQKLTLEQQLELTTTTHEVKTKPPRLERPLVVKTVNNVTGFRSWLPAIGIGAKTSAVSFAFTMSIITIAASLALAMPPVAMVAAATGTVLAITAGVALSCFALGTACTFIYKKAIAPQIEARKLLAEKKQNANNELTYMHSKLAIGKEHIANQKTEIAALTADINAETTQNQTLVHNFKKMFHPTVEKTPSVEDALLAANHPKVRPLHAEVNAAAHVEKNNIFDTMIRNLSPEEKEALIHKLQNQQQKVPEPCIEG